MRPRTASRDFSGWSVRACAISSASTPGTCPIPRGMQAYRKLSIDTEAFDFSSGFTDLHRELPPDSGGRGLRTARCAGRRGAAPRHTPDGARGLVGDYHPMAFGLERRVPLPCPPQNLWNMSVRMVDLYGQYEELKAEIDAGMRSVIAESAFINGPAVRGFRPRTVGLPRRAPHPAVRQRHRRADPGADGR